MPTPDSGQISLNDLNAALGKGSTTMITLASASLGYYQSINTNSIDKPDNSAPYSVSEWYGYNESAIATTMFNISSDNSPDTGACSLAIDTVLYHDGLTDEPTPGDFIYMDSEGAEPFDGGGNFFKIDGNLIISIASNGEVVSSQGCRG